MNGIAPLRDADPDWLHALRNAVNAAGIAVAAARSAIDSGDAERARYFLDESAGACKRAATLLHPAPADGHTPA